MLNISGVSGPFSNMVNQVLVYIPNIIAAVVVGFIGWIVARLVRAGVTNVLSRTQLDDKLSSEVGVGGISQNIGEILYWLVLLLFLPISNQRLRFTVTSVLTLRWLLSNQGIPVRFSLLKKTLRRFLASSELRFMERPVMFSGTTFHLVSNFTRSLKFLA
ncbi:membrane protein [Klebsiella pneumoniae]